MIAVKNIEQAFGDTVQSSEIRFLGENPHLPGRADQKLEIPFVSSFDGVDHGLTHLLRNPADHAEIEQDQFTGRADQQVARMWIGVKVPLDQHLLGIKKYQPLHQLIK